MRTFSKNAFLVLIGLSSFVYGHSQGNNLIVRPDFNQINTVFQQLKGYQKVLIKTNLDSLTLHKFKGRKQPAYLIASGIDKPILELPIQIEARGKFRRRICDFPPIKLLFPKAALKKQNLYSEYNKLKLVTPCLLEGKNQQALLKEYWVYKMYNHVSPNSFQVHLIEITYIDSVNPRRKIKNLAFIIENTDEIAHRINGKIVKGKGNTAATISMKSYHETLLFNYCIGNTDWRIDMQKNVKLILLEGASKLTVIPYDFDFTGLVNPPYMKILPMLDAENNPANRVALGQFSDLESLKETAARFLDLKKPGFQCYKDCPLLTASNKRAIRFYLQPIFRFLKNEKKLKDVFLADVN